MHKLFNRKTYVIKTVKPERIPDLLALAKENGLKVIYPDLFENRNDDIHRLVIDDRRLGGMLMVMVCDYEISLMKNPAYGVFEDVEDLLRYVRWAKRRKERPFISYKSKHRYISYLFTLDEAGLRKEWGFAKEAVSLLASWRRGHRFNFEHRVLASLRLVSPKEKAVDYCLAGLNGLRKFIDRDLGYNIFALDGEESKATPKDAMGALVTLFEFIHYGKLSPLLELSALREKVNRILNLFNYKLKVEGKASLDRPLYFCLERYKVNGRIPDSLIGEKKGGQWDYDSVIMNLTEMLKS